MSQTPSNLDQSDATSDAQPVGSHGTRHVHDHNQPEPHQTTGYLLILLGPILAVGAFTALLAMGVGLAGWYRMEMLAVAAGTGVLVAVITIGLLYVRLAERRADRLALRNAEARVGDILESAMDAIITVDQNQRIVLFNVAAETVFGCARDQAIGSHLSSFTRVFTQRCGACHTVQKLTPDLKKEPMPQREASLRKFLERHHAPPAADRDAIVAYLIRESSK